LIESSNLGLKKFDPSKDADPNTIAQVRARYEKLTLEDMR
jgi:hypothetical protein